MKDLNKQNPHQNIPEILEIENRLNQKSTFFFRTFVEESRHPPPPYDLNEYRSEIRFMISKGWEVGLHSDFVSHSNFERLEREKKELEAIGGVRILGNRVHYMLKSSILMGNLKKLGFEYDSSIKYRRDKVSKKDFGYLLKEGVIVFPITIMDALIFEYNVKTEDDVLKVVKRAVDTCKKTHRKRRIITLVWHDYSLKQKKGRKYSEVLEYLISRKEVHIKGVQI